jgi:hypothetical protein
MISRYLYIPLVTNVNLKRYVQLLHLSKSFARLLSFMKNDMQLAQAVLYGYQRHYLINYPKCVSNPYIEITIDDVESDPLLNFDQCDLWKKRWFTDDDNVNDDEYDEEEKFIAKKMIFLQALVNEWIRRKIIKFSPNAKPKYLHSSKTDCLFAVCCTEGIVLKDIYYASPLPDTWYEDGFWEDNTEYGILGLRINKYILLIGNRDYIVFRT